MVRCGKVWLSCGKVWLSCGKMWMDCGELWQVVGSSNVAEQGKIPSSSGVLMI